jgi:hypothetical protein
MPKSAKEYKERMLKLDDYAIGWDEVWKDCADFILPWRTKFLHREGTQGNRGRRGSRRGRSTSYGGDRANELLVNDERINSTATMAVRLGAAGMMQGFTSPARPWFRLTTSDPELAENPAVSKWLWDVEARIRSQMQRSNIYQTLPAVYESMLTFGPAAMHLDEDPQTVLRSYMWPIGSYRLALDDTNRVDTIYRRVRLTVRQSVQKFGLEAQTQKVKELYNKSKYDEPIDIIHAIEPNPGYTGKGLTDKPYVSVWVDENNAKEHELLHVGGYDEFPVLTPRWGLLDEDVYGYSPAMDALGDIKALQLYERRKAQASDWMNRPLLAVPASLGMAKEDLVPGHVIYTTGANKGDQIRPAYTVPPQAVTAMGEQIAAHELRINRLLHADMWLLAADTTKQMTATEVIERRQEKMQQLGAVVERINDELAEPLVDRFFYVMLRKGLLPEAPDELAGKDLKVEFISEMAQAQKMVALGGIQQAVMFNGTMAQFNPEVVDVMDYDQAQRDFNEAAGISPDLTVSKDDVAEIRAQRAQQQQAMAEAEQMQMQADATQKLANSPVGEGSALDGMLGTLGGPAAGGATGGVS